MNSRILLSMAFAALLGCGQAMAQDSAQPSGIGYAPNGSPQEFEPLPDYDAVKKAGFSILQLDRGLSDDKTPGLRAKFVTPIVPAGYQGDFNFGWALYDITGDGMNEVFISYQNAITCRNDGCRTVVYQYDGKDWKPIFDAMAPEIAVKPGKDGQPGEIAIVDEKVTFWSWNQQEGKYEQKP